MDQLKRNRGAQPTHGGAYFPEYRVWVQMKARCNNPNHAQFASYGGRGITICERWMNDFGAFISDMGRRPNGKYSIDRIDNDKGYSPENCRWATMVQQQRNKRTNVILTVNGISLPMAEWAAQRGIDKWLIGIRIRHGWSVASAINTPPDRCLNSARRKLSDSAIADIRAMAMSGQKTKDISDKFKVTTGYIRHIVRGERRRPAMGVAQ